MGRVKRICVFEHSIMTNFNCACPAIQRGQGSGFLSDGSSWHSLLVWASSGGSGETARMRRLAWTFAARIGDKYQIRLTRPKCSSGKSFPHLWSYNDIRKTEPGSRFRPSNMFTLSIQDFSLIVFRKKCVLLYLVRKLKKNNFYSFDHFT